MCSLVFGENMYSLTVFLTERESVKLLFHAEFIVYKTVAVMVSCVLLLLFSFYFVPF